MKKIIRFFVDFVNGKRQYEKLLSEVTELYFYIKAKESSNRYSSTIEENAWCKGTLHNKYYYAAHNLRDIMGKFQQVKNRDNLFIIENHYNELYESQISKTVKMKVDLDILCEPDDDWGIGYIDDKYKNENKWNKISEITEA